MSEMKCRVNKMLLISDTHAGSSVALFNGHTMDDGQYVNPSPLQKKLWAHWEAFWEWAYDRIGKEPFALAHLGDPMDGRHHKSTQAVSLNLHDQRTIAEGILRPHREKAAKFYQVRGTEAHGGPSDEDEESLARSLEAEKCGGLYSHWEIWIKWSEWNYLVNLSHHIGHTSSTAYESSALMREMTAAFSESAQWGWRAPGIVARGHTHRYLHIDGPGELNMDGWHGIKLPGWQCKTGYVYKNDRLRGPQFGGVLLEATPHGVEVHKWVKNLKQGAVFTL